MPTDYTDQFFTFDPANPPAVGTSISITVFVLTDENDDDDVDTSDGDAVDGSDITAAWPGDTVTINVPGTGNVTYTGITFYLADGRRVFTPTDGQVLEEGTLVSTTFVTSQGPLDVDDLGPLCFTAGTLIRTPSGEIPVELLQIGDAVETWDREAQRIIWCGRRTVKGEGAFAPVEFAAGVYGNERRIRLSQQHRVLLTGWRCQLYFGQNELLVAAKHLSDGNSINIIPVSEIEYFHIMFADHEIICAEGMPCESFNPVGNFARQDRAVASEIHALFPELACAQPDTKPIARPVLKRRETGILRGDVRL